MSPFPAVHVSLSLLVLTRLHIQSAGPPITCEAGTFVTGEEASVKCNFGTNITATRRSFSLARWPVDGQKGTIETDILLCPWSTEKNKHDCFVEMPNYTFDGHITDHLTVRIKEVGLEHTGSYMCFFVPSEGTESHLCILRVKVKAASTTTAKPVTGTTDETEERQDLSIIVPCVLVIVAVMVSSVGVLVFLRRRRAKRSRSGKHVGLTKNPESNEPLIPEPDMPIVPEKRSKEELFLEDLQLTHSKLQHLMTMLDKEMAKGLNEATRCEADIKMFPTFVSPLSGGSGKGLLLVLDLGNTHLKASLVNLEGTNPQILRSQGYPIPDDKECGTVGQLFDFMANCTNEFIKEENLSGKLPLALIVGFPCEHTSVGETCLVKWTKEVSYSGTDNGDLYTLLSEAVDRRAKQKSTVPKWFDDLRKLVIAAFVNDAVSTLVSVAFNNSDCKIGLVVDSGFNACYVEDSTHVEMDNTADENPRETIINTELGALGENGCLDFCRTEFDKELDKYSRSPGSQILEKMVGGMYIGEIVRLVLEGMTKSNLLFHKVPLACALFQRARLTTVRVIIIEGDTEEPYENTSGVLDGLGVTDYTVDDLKTVRLACRAVCERAAYLAAASLASLINHINQPEVTVVVDGYLYQAHPRFHDLMYSKTLELITPGLKFYLESPMYVRAVGAARIATASVRSLNKQSSGSSKKQSVKC